MDNELNNVVNNELAEAGIMDTVKGALPIAGGFIAGIGAGVLLDRFVIRPLIKKLQNKKAAKEAKPVDEEPKAEEE